ncbi:MAG: DoxX family protein [Anaeromyxobacteraceae bacterium]
MPPTVIETIHRHLTDRGWALLPLRVMVGFGFAAHGYAKLVRGPEAFAAVVAAMGMPAPTTVAWATLLIELIGGVALIAGAAVVPTVVPLCAIMVTAMIGVHLPYGFSSIKLKALSASGAEFGPPGYELNLVYIAALVTLALAGSSALSIDRLLERRKRRLSSHFGDVRNAQVTRP